MFMEDHTKNPFTVNLLGDATEPAPALFVNCCMDETVGPALSASHGKSVIKRLPSRQLEN